MKALVLEEYNKFVYKDQPVPEYGPADVLIEVKACAVCGSDVHGMDGSTGRRIPPVIMGHEASGVIAECGSQVKEYKKGDRVTFDSTVYCGECENCKAGRINLCSNRRVLGVSCDEYRMNGAFAQYVAIPEHILYRLPDNVDYVQAAMVEPLSVAYHAVMRAPVPKGGTAVVIGVGTIGILVVQVLKAFGVKTVIAVDIADDKLRFAMEHGADHAVNARAEDAAQQVVILTKDGCGADASYDATGISSTLQMSLQTVKKGGSVVMIGNLAAKTDFPLQWVVTREMSLYGSCASAGEYPACLDLIANGKVDVNAVISKVVPLSDGNEWIHYVHDGDKGLSKIVLIP